MREIKELEKNIVALERQLSELRDRRLELLRYFKEDIEIGSLDSTIDKDTKATWKLLLENNEVYWSDELYSIFELEKDIETEDLYEKYFSALSKTDQKIIKEKIEGVLSGKLNDYYLLQQIKLANKKTKWLSCSGFPIYENDQIIGLSGGVIEITSEYGSAQSLNLFFEQSVDLQCIANNKGYFLKISPSWSKLLGYSDAELCSQPFINFVHPKDRNLTSDEADQLDDGNPTIKFENRYISKNGDIVFLSWSSRKDEVNGLFYCTARDVTQERALQESLKREAHEKDMLLREIHHRVKNNLQIISSLLSLQAKMKYDKKSINQLLLESQNRVKAMASIHEHFYQANDVARLDFKDYASKLIHDLIFAYKGNKMNVLTEFNMDECQLDLDTAVPLGLIINEIISNSLKHGFTDEVENSMISFTMKEESDNYFLILGDNGKGCVIDFTQENDDSLGLIIVNGLIDQIDGVIKQINSKKGTWIELSIPKK